MTYFLAHNSINVFHYGELNEGQVVTTGQPNLEYFDNLNTLKERLAELGVTCDENTGPNLPDLGDYDGDVDMSEPN